MSGEMSGGVSGDAADLGLGTPARGAAERFDAGRLLRAMRRARGTSQREFAAVVGVGASLIAKYERGRHVPGVAQLDVMARSAGFRLVVVDDATGQVLVVDDEHDAIRDRGGRRFPAHLHWGGKPECTWNNPPWWGWHHVAFYNGDPAVPGHVYWTRRNDDGSPWCPSPTALGPPYMGDDNPGPDGADWEDPDGEEPGPEDSGVEEPDAWLD